MKHFAVGTDLICSVLLFASLGACGGVEAADRRPDDRSLVVTRGDFVPMTLLSGELVAEEAERFVVPNANVWPVQIQWLAEDGAELEAGEAVVAFDNTQVVSSLEQSRQAVLDAEERLASERARVASSLEESAFALEQAKATLAKAELEADVPKELFSAREYEDRQLALRRAELDLTKAEGVLASTRESGQADIAIAAVALDKARLEVAVVERRLGSLEMLAPRDGVVLRHENRQEALRPYEIGDSVWPGLTVASLPSLATLMVEAALYDVDDGRVGPGQRVTARLDAYPERTYSGRVRSVDALAEVAGTRSSRRVFRVLVDLETLDPERMRPGMSVKLEVFGAAQASVLLVPRPAISWHQGEATIIDPSGRRAPIEVEYCAPAVCVATDGVEEGQALGVASAADLRGTGAS